MIHIHTLHDKDKYGLTDPEGYPSQHSGPGMSSIHCEASWVDHGMPGVRGLVLKSFASYAQTKAAPGQAVRQQPDSAA